MEKDQTIIGKYKTTELRKTHSQSKGSWLVYTLRCIIRTIERVTRPSKFLFHNNRDTANHNTRFLKQYRYDLEKAMYKERGIMPEPGSKFRKEGTLELLLRYHKNCRKMRNIITDCVT